MSGTLYPSPLLLPGEDGRAALSDLWCECRARDLHALALFSRHYSFNGRGNHLQSGIAGPGESMVLISPNADALFIWRQERFRRDEQTGINCAVFRNESSTGTQSSTLIRDAMRLAWRRWPGQRLFTFVDARKVRSSNPGYCFRCAGWERVGKTGRGLIILECNEKRDI